MILGKVPPKVMIFISVAGLLIVIVLALLSFSVQPRSNPREMEGIYRILVIPKDPNDFVGGEYFQLGPGDELQLRPDTSKPDCQQYSPCRPEMGKWYLEGEHLILKMENFSIKGKVVGNTVIFEDDVCGRRKILPKSGNCNIVRELGGETYMRPKGGCLTLEQAYLFAYSVDFKVPTWLPEGYEFKCSMGVGPEIYLNFAPKDANITFANYGLAQGAVVIYAIDEGRYVGEEFASRNTTELVIQQCNRSIFYPTCKVLNGKMTFIVDGCINLGKPVVDVKGRVKIVEKCGITSEIRFYDGSISYRIKGNLPASQLLKIVESMR